MSARICSDSSSRMPNDFIGRPHVVDLRPLCALGLKQPIDPIKGHSPVIADDAAAPVSIRKAGNDPGPSAIHDFRRIGIEHAVIVRFSIFRESLVHSRIGLETRGLQARLDHAQASEREDRPLERLVGLKAHDDFVVAIDIAGLVGEQRRGIFCIDRKHPLLSFFREIRLQFRPNGFCALRRPRKKVLVPGVRRDVPDDEIANVDGSRPTPGRKPFQQSPASASFLGAALAFMVRLPAVYIGCLGVHGRPELPRLVRGTPIIVAPGPWRLIYVKPSGRLETLSPRVSASFVTHRTAEKTRARGLGSPRTDMRHRRPSKAVRPFRHCVWDAPVVLRIFVHQPKRFFSAVPPVITNA